MNVNYKSIRINFIFALPNYNTMINVPLLKTICELPGVPGYEQKVRELVLAQIKQLVDSIEIDNLGNVIGLKKGKSKQAKKVMIAAHMDEIGFIVTHIDENGFFTHWEVSIRKH
jgi:tetrahedral aminopeptidase